MAVRLPKRYSMCSLYKINYQNTLFLKEKDCVLNLLNYKEISPSCLCSMLSEDKTMYMYHAHTRTRFKNKSSSGSFYFGKIPTKMSK